MRSGCCRAMALWWMRTVGSGWSRGGGGSTYGGASIWGVEEVTGTALLLGDGAVLDAKRVLRKGVLLNATKGHPSAQQSTGRSWVIPMGAAAQARLILHASCPCAGKIIGGLNEEGQVELYDAEEDGAPAVQLTAAEEEAEQLMRQAAISWNVHQNK